MLFKMINKFDKTTLVCFNWLHHNKLIDYLIWTNYLIIIWLIKMNIIKLDFKKLCWLWLSIDL